MAKDVKAIRNRWAKRERRRRRRAGECVDCREQAGYFCRCDRCAALAVKAQRKYRRRIARQALDDSLPRRPDTGK